MPPSPSPQQPVVVVGGGWAGLATAVELCEKRVPVVVVEAARQTGGRARSVRRTDTVIDNGQHLVTGACQSLLTLMDRIAVDHRNAFLRLPLTIRLFKADKPSLTLTAPRLPAPLHLLVAILGASGLSIRERVRALRFGRRLPDTDIPRERDISVQALLHSEAQTPDLIRKLWEPLCVATLNTPVAEASARIFIRVLQESFLGHRRHSDLLIPKRELSDMLPRPCIDYLEHRGARIELGQRVTRLEIKDGSIEAVHIRERRLQASHVVLATPHSISRRLMSQHKPLQALCKQLADLSYEPVVTLYLQYPPGVRLPHPVVGLEDSLGQWVFDRRVCGQPGMMAVVISGRGAHSRMTGEELRRQVEAELAASFPHWPGPLRSYLIREKRATFTSRVGVDAVRPASSTAVSGLWLAGDYTATELPATLEGAVRSGINCANALMHTVNRTRPSQGGG